MSLEVLFQYFLVMGDGTFQNYVDWPTGYLSYRLVAADFNGDGKSDIATANTYNNTVSILIGNGDGTFQSPVEFSTGSYPFSITVADFNGDGLTDLATANNANNSVSVLLGNGDGSFQTSVNYSVGANPIGITTGDFNGDNKMDIATTNYNTYDVSVLIGNGDGTFQIKSDYPIGSRAFGIVSGDFNSDSRTDLAVASTWSNEVAILSNIKKDTTPPELNLFTNPTVLWPPNHEMVDVFIGGVARDLESGLASVVFTVTDEYGIIQPTISGFNTTIKLEAWRAGDDKDGRRYSIKAVATDFAGNVSTASTVVLVPHDLR